MGNRFTNHREGRQNDDSSLNVDLKTESAQGALADSKQSQSRQSENTQQGGSIDGFGKFKVDVGNMLAPQHVLMLATLFFTNNAAVTDRIQNSINPGLNILLELEIRGVISREDISQLTNALQQNNFGGIASNVADSYRTNVLSQRTSQSLTSKGKNFIRQLKISYKKLYDSVQPLPYVKDKMCCVDKIFIQGNIQRRSTNERRKEIWQSVYSYHDILGEGRDESTRYVIFGDPGYGKSTLLLQFLYDWCNQVQESPLKDVDIVIYLRMRQLGGLTSIYQAIKELLLPKDSSLTVGDINEILQDTGSTMIFFDGYDEYPDKENINTDYIKILRMEMLVDTFVILTTRSAKVRETPEELKTQSIQFKLTGFTKEDQDKYIMKAVVGGDDDAARFVRTKLNENPILDDMCQIPLLFTIIAHATHDEKNIIPNTKSVTWFFRFMIECFFNHTSNKLNSGEVTSEVARDQLSRIALQGLSNQTIVWSKQFFVEEVGKDNYNTLIRTGILIEDERIDVADRADAKNFFRQLITTSFYHKLFCEFYAAYYLVDLIQLVTGHVSGKSLSKVVTRSLSLFIKVSGSSSSKVNDLFSGLDNKDLQYLFRFTCGLDDKAGCVIINYLMKHAADTNLATLCILEFFGDDGDITDAVRELCSHNLQVESDDSLIRQRATIRLLEIASRNNIPISDLHFRWSFSQVDEGGIVLQSGLKLPRLASLEKVTIEGSEVGTAKLSEDDVIGLLNYGLQSQRFKELWFKDYVLPESIRCDVIPRSSITRNIKVMAPHHARQFDLQSGSWTTMKEIEDIKELCSDTVYIHNKTSEPIQRSFIDLLVKAASHDITIFRLDLYQSFHSVGVDGSINLNSGLSLPILPSLEEIVIRTETGREIDEDEANGILNHLTQWERLKAVGYG